MIDATLEMISALDGTWRGTGRGDYPTIDAFRYEETLRFELDRAYPMFHFEQRAYLLPGREPSHWESGFIRLMEDGNIEMSSAQDSGRVEVLRGKPETLVEGSGFDVTLDHVVLAHDPRLHATRRSFRLEGDRLHYIVYMATHTTPQPELQQHLIAELERAG